MVGAAQRAAQKNGALKLGGRPPAGLIETKDARLMRDLRDFAKQWDINIKQQGFMEVFVRQYGAANGATTEGTVTRQGDGPQGQ
jgi:hypothetical protein